MTVSKADEKAIVSYVTFLADLFNLDAYSISVRCFSGHASPNAAETEITPNTRLVTITLHNDFWNTTLEDQTRILIHEVLHIVTSPLYDWSERLIRHNCPRVAMPMLNAQTEAIEERVVERLAHSIAKLLPTWKGKKHAPRNHRHRPRT